jgi:Tfp pilus assembly protein PilF
MSDRDAEPWLRDFTLVLSDSHIRLEAQDPRQFEVFTGSKALAAAFTSPCGVLGGAFGAALVSRALWSSLILTPAWLVLLVAVWMLVGRVSLASMGRGIRFLAGWCFFWGFLLGLVAMWGAQMHAPGWAYGVAGGLGLLLGITHGAYEPPDMKHHDGWTVLGTLLAPVAAIGAVVVHRHVLDGPITLPVAATTGAVAGFVFMAPLMAMLAANWDNERGLRRLGQLCLHSETAAGRGIPILDRALKMKPEEPELYSLRALASALAGDEAAAEADWRRHLDLKPRSIEPMLGRAIVLLRRGAVDDAVPLLEAAVKRRPSDTRALATLALAHQRRGELDKAIPLYERATKGAADPLTVTRLAQAHYDAGRYRKALELSDVAIDELDSVHGRSWLVRARAHLALGDLEHAEEDFRRAQEDADEDAVEAEAQAGLEAMGLDIA